MVYKRAWAEIDLKNLAHNLHILKNSANTPANIMGIVKADAYGHGAVEVSKTLIEGGINSLGVAILEEGMELREHGIGTDILIMSYTPSELLENVVRYNLTQTIFSKYGARMLGQAGEKFNIKPKVHIKIDTGMSRLGFLPNEKSVQEILQIAQIPNIFIEGIYTHFATSDAIDNGFMHEQLARFDWIVEKLESHGLKIPLRHVSNSGAFSHIHRGGQDQFYKDHVRLGIMLYGYPPSTEMGDRVKPLGLKPVMKLKSRISMIKELDENVGISYGHLYKTQTKSKIAVLPLGYADGYPRRLTHGGQVMVNGAFAPIAGAICMDQCMVDVTRVPGIDHINPGHPVTMMGEAGICADNLADIVGTISYEILCGIGKRVPRIYV